MKGIIIFLTIFLLNNQGLRAQNVDSVFKITVDYYWDHNDLKNDEYAHTEFFEFLRIDSGYFKNSLYTLIIYRENKDAHTLLTDTIIVPVNKSPAIPAEYIKRMLIELNTNKANLNAGFILPHLEKPLKKQIQRIALNNWDNPSTDYYRMRRAKIYKRIKQFYQFDSFLLSLKLDTALRGIIVVGEGKASNIKVMSRADTTIYICSFNDLTVEPHIAGQPVERMNYGDAYHTNQVTNLEINEAIISLLPAKCFLRKQIDLNSITNRYILWFIKKGR
jgi:hypothetical protein